MEKVVIVKDVLKNVPRFNLAGHLMEFTIKPVPIKADPVAWIKDAVKEIVVKGTDNVQSTDLVGFTFCSKDFQKGDGWLRFKRAEEVTVDEVWEMISKVYQSNSTGLNTETFCLGVTTVKMPMGRGRNGKYNDFFEECAKRKGIISIKNNDNMCLPRALVVAIAYVSKDPLLNNIRRDNKKIQCERAYKLCQSAGVTIPTEGAGIKELKMFQDYLCNYRIVVYKYGSKGREVIFQGPTCADGGPCLNLLFHNAHYNVITSLTGAFACSYYCEECHVPFNSKNNHRCGGSCPCCQQSPSCQPTAQIECKDCLRSFRGQLCFENHKRANSLGTDSVCNQVRLCPVCLKTINAQRKHTCGEIFCKICQKHHPEGHYCYIQPDKKTPNLKNHLYIFYDLETRQEKLLADGTLLHEPNLCVFNQRCCQCIDNEVKLCQNCGMTQQIYKCNDPISPFMHHLLTLRKKFQKITVLSHNGGKFDIQFILNYILTQSDLKAEVIMRGTQVILLEVGNIQFIDSLNYFPMALSKLPKTFGLPDTFKKGYFPHFFNTKVNENYIGPLPDMKFYGPDSMKPDDRDKFIKWYNEHKTDTFDMQKEIVEYCISDVEILTRACLQFRKLMLEQCNVCPFTEAVTIASACNKVFRRKYLRQNTIGIIPKNGYRLVNNQSQVAIDWMCWEEFRQKINIIHAGKQQEVTLKGTKVDGYNADTGEIFEFHGCYYHGCVRCFKYQRSDSINGDTLDTMDTRYERTVKRTERLKSFGYKVTEMWECRFKEMLVENPDIQQYLNSISSAKPLKARDAFYGGRTGNTHKYYKCINGEKIKYIDVCSLYPWVCKYGKFPLGHPKIYVGKEAENINLNEINGLVKCKILPPQNLFHPVLPVKMNEKLMFVLCRTCGENLNSECNHNNEQRALTGTWVSDEVLKAIEMGYEILEMHEIWAYNVEQYDKSKRSGGLFTNMMNHFIKIKQQASGWPQNNMSETDKAQYIEDFLNAEGVKLDINDMVENPGLRSLSKLILNSFWGKFGQRENQPKTAIINNPSQFFEIMANPSIYVNSITPINDETVLVNWEHIEEAADTLSTVNVVIASFVTAQARLKLYRYLEMLDDRVLYYDTDSVIYVSRENEPEPPTGTFVGDMTDELAVYGPGSYITEFVSGGPKNYAYTVWSTKNQREEVTCKVKGISLSYEASALVNFESIKQMILEETEPISIVSKQIQRTKDHQVITKETAKIYRINSTKRKFCEDYSSLPYGYKKRKLDENV